MTTAVATRDSANDTISPSYPEQRIKFNQKRLKNLQAGYGEAVKTVADALNGSPELRMAAEKVLVATAVTSYAIMRESKTPLRPVDPAMLKVKGGKVSKKPGSRKGGNKFWQFVCKKYSQAEKNKEGPKKQRERGDFHREVSQMLDDPENHFQTRHRLKMMYIESPEFLEMDKDKQHKFINEHLESESYTERSDDMKNKFMKSVNVVMNTDVVNKSKPKKKASSTPKKKARSKPDEETDDASEGEEDNPPIYADRDS